MSDQGIEVSPSPRHVLILMSDTGGGHRAAAEAIRDALKQRHGDAIKIDLVDVFREYSPFPFKYAPILYPWWIKRGRLAWNVSFRLSNRKRQARFMMRSLGLAIWQGLRRLLREHPADVIICVHPMLVTPALNILRRQTDRPAFITVVTDLVSGHAFWYDRNADRVLVPTQPAYARGLKLGVRAEQMRVTGLPVNPRFTLGLLDKAVARAHLEWDPDLPAILVIGGGEGMGPLYRITRRIDRLNVNYSALPIARSPSCQLAIVAGRNETLYTRLQAETWHQPTHIYPFVTNIPELMAAADVLITKAGPATISEACIAGLPMILSDAIPGQETGNVRYVRDNQAGVYAPGPTKVVRAIRSWLAQGPDFLKARAEKARQLAHPNAVWDIADEIWMYAQQPRIPRQPSRRNRP